MRTLLATHSASQLDVELAEMSFRVAEGNLNLAEERFRYSLVSRSQAVAHGLRGAVGPSRIPAALPPTSTFTDADVGPGGHADYFHDADRNASTWAIATKQAPLPKRYPGAWTKGVLAYNGRTRWL